MPTHKKLTFVNVISVLALIALATFLRWDDLTIANQGAKGIEATYHTMLTGKALANNPFSSHYGLPTVTLNPSLDTTPPTWGSTKVSDGGSMIYTSFPPLGFYPVSFLYSMWGDINTTHITLLGMILAIFSALLAGILCQNLQKTLNPNTPLSQTSRYFWGGSFLYMLTPEVTISQGLVYWPHALTQLTILLSLISLLQYLQQTVNKKKRLWLLLLILSAMFTCLLEWTGYLLVAGLCTSLLILTIRNKKQRLENIKSLILIALSGISALFITIFHFCSGISCSAFISTSMIRAERRSITETQDYSWLGIAEAYLSSLGALILVLLVFPLIIKKRRDLPQSFFLVLLPAVFIGLENVILLQHALQFPFDRMKMVIPLGILTVSFLHLYKIKKEYIFLAAITIFASNTLILASHRASYKAWQEITEHNNQKVAEIKTNNMFTCAEISTNSKVRGYLNITFGKDIFEFSETPEDIFKKRPQTCAVLHIETKHPYTDLAKIINTRWIKNPNQ